MPFEEITEGVSSRPEQAPASIRLRRRRGGKPGCIVGLRRVLMTDIGWKDCDVVLLIGNGDDTGKIRLKKTAKGKGLAPLRSMKSGSAVVDLGFVSSFGERPKLGVPIDAKKVSDGVIELTLPDWSKVEDEPEDAPASDGDDEEEPAPPHPQFTQAARPAAPAAQITKPAQNGSSARSQTPATSVEKAGVVVTVHPLSSSISCDGDGIKITERQANFLGALTRSIGSIVVTGNLIDKMDLPQSGGASIVADEYAALAPKLLEIGLKLRTIPKMGYSLSKE